ERSEEGANLVVDLVGIVDGGGNFLSEQHSIAAAETVNGDADGPLAGPKSRGDRRIGPAVRAMGQYGLQFFEGRRSPGGGVFRAEPIETPVQQSQCPAPVEDSIRAQLADRLA